MLGAILGTVAIVLVVVVIGYLVDRKIHIFPRPEDFERETKDRKPTAPKYEVGEAPATALRVRDDQLAKTRTAQKCPKCRAAMESEADDVVRYDNAEMLVLRFTCPTCSTKRSLYVTTR